MTELPDILGEDLGYLLGWVALGETLGDDDGCEAARAMGVGEDLWKCDECGEVIRYVDDPNGTVWLTDLHPYRNRKVRVELVTPGDRPGNREWWS